MVNSSTNFIDKCFLCGSIYSVLENLRVIVQLAPASRWGLSYAESACVTDLKGPTF